MSKDNPCSQRFQGFLLLLFNFDWINTKPNIAFPTPLKLGQTFMDVGFDEQNVACFLVAEVPVTQKTGNFCVWQ